MSVVIISGGSSGIGEACVAKFLDHDYQVYNLDIKDNKKFVGSKNYQWLKTDVKDYNNIVNSINEVNIQVESIDTLIVSAGKHLSANIESTTNEQLFDIIELNLYGAFWLIQAVIPVMKKQNYGKIITIGSDQSIIAKTNSSAYGMSKAALLSLTKSIALDYAPFNIQANCIGAGTIDTPLYRNAIINYANRTKIALEDIEASEAKEQPAGRIGKPEEVAGLAFFLSQPASDYMTGAYIPIDGGYTAR